MIWRFLMKIVTIVILVSAALCSEAFAALCVQTNNQVGLTGLDSANGIITARVTGHDNQCGCNEFRFQPTDTDVDAALSILITAKLSNIPVRIDVPNFNDCNSAFRVYLQ